MNDNNNIINESVSGTNIENYKIVILGDQYVGKTSILNKFKYENLDEKYTPTIGIDFLTKNVYLEDKTIRLIMWDTAGSERFKSLIPSYIKNANAIILAYDLTSKSSFTSLEKWMSDISDKVPSNAYIIITGNKLDLENKRQVSLEDVKKFCDEKNLQFVETSAKTGQNIKLLFDTITGCLYNNSNMIPEKDKTNIVLEQPTNDEKQKVKSGCKGKACGGGKKKKKDKENEVVVLKDKIDVK